jgi:dipeptidyl aminopeptidase/acylaminoacyl peptidase
VLSRVSSALFCFLVLWQIGCSSTSAKTGYQGLGKESVAEATLARFAPPALDSELSRKIQNYLDLRSPGMGLLSPDKKSLFFSWRVTGTSQVWKLEQPKGFPIQMTGGEDQTGVAGITEDGRWLILSRDRNGEENPGLYLQSTQGGPLKAIQHKPKVQTHFEFSSKDSKFIIYRSNDIKPDSYAFYKYEIESGKSELMFAQDGYWVLSDFTDDGRWLLTKVVTNTATEVFEFQTTTRELKPVIGQGEKQEHSVQFAAQKGKYLVLTPKLGDFRRLYLWDFKNLHPITSEMRWDVSRFEIDPTRRRLLYSVNEGGFTRLEALDARTFKPLDFPKFPGMDHVTMGSLSRDGETVMVGVDNGRSPRVSYSYDFRKRQLTQWVIPSQPELPTENFARAELEFYTARDGVKIPMFVRRPAQCRLKSDNPCPVVVHFHGGPEGQSMAGFHVLAQMFVDQGIVFVEPNVRGSDGYGKKWLDSDNVERRLEVITDIEDAATSIKKNWAVSGKTPKVGVMGWSYGGYSSLMAMTYFAGSYEAGVALVGMSDLITFLNNTAPYRRALRTPEYGDPVKDREVLKKLSPVTYLDRVRAPLMIIQGVNDPRVPAGEAVQIQRLLSQKGIESPLILFADEGHGAAKRSNKVLELGHTLNFFKKNLQ